MSENWILASPMDAIIEDDVISVVVEGKEIALYEVEGEVFATDNICTHGFARLSDGFLEDGAIECPLHQGRFCVRTGKVLSAPLTEAIRSYPVKVEDEQVWITLG